MWLSSALLLCIFFALALVTTGTPRESAIVTALLCPLILLSCYFATRRHRAAPTRTERTLAGAWLLIRRAFCFLGAVLFGSTAVFGGYSAFIERSGGTLVGSVMSLAMAVACVWWGVYGSTGREGAFREDKAKHEERKRRYGWK